MNVMGCFTDLSELRVFMSCGSMFCLTDRVSRIRQHFARTTVCRWKMEIYLICVPAGVTQSGSSCGSHVYSRCALVLPEMAWSVWMGGEYGDLMKGGIEKFMCVILLCTGNM